MMNCTMNVCFSIMVYTMVLESGGFVEAEWLYRNYNNFYQKKNLIVSNSIIFLPQKKYNIVKPTTKNKNSEKHLVYVIVVLTLKFYNLLKQKTKNKTGCVDLIKSNYYEIEVLNSIIFNPKKAGKKNPWTMLSLILFN